MQSIFWHTCPRHICHRKAHDFQCRRPSLTKTCLQIEADRDFWSVCIIHVSRDAIEYFKCMNTDINLLTCVLSQQAFRWPRTLHRGKKPGRTLLYGRCNVQAMALPRLFGKSGNGKTQRIWVDPMEGYQEPTLYEPRFGLPIVRKRLTYAQLLKEIRQGKVKEVSYFDCNDAPGENDKYRMKNITMEGYCLVRYQDDFVAQAYVPPEDVRMNYAMETHGVTQSRMLGPPGPGGILDKPFSLGPFQDKALAFLPIGLMIALYVATQVAAWLKGDRADRQAMREYDIRMEKLAKQRAEADERAQLPVTMAKEGASVETICRTLEMSKTPYSRDYIEKLVEEMGQSQEPEPSDGIIVSAEQQQRQDAMTARIKKDAEDNMSEMDRAKELLKMKTVKIQQASKPEDAEQREMRIRMRKAQSEMKGVKLQYTDEGRVTFDDVAGIGESKIELTEIVDFFTKPGRFKASGAKVPKGLLMCGPPGTGKTLMARAVAGEARVAFLSLNASEFVEMFAGLGASRVRDLFRQARSLSPAIIFIDEIDAVGRQRGGAKGNDERDQTLNQLLIEMDGFGDESGVIVMAATNRLDVLDSALVRPGRFDRIIEVGLPDFDGRIEVLKVHLGYRAHADDIDFKELSFETQAFSGAQLAGLVNSAAIVASRYGRQAIGMQDFTEALEEDRLGAKKRGAYSVEQQMRIAIQEGATALVCCLMPAIEPITYVTTVPRQRFPLGQTVLRVSEQRERNNLYTRRYLQEQLMTVLAGRAAEEIKYGLDEMSTINQRRLVTARRIAAKLIYSGAMTDKENWQSGPLTVPFEAGDGSLLQMIPERIDVVQQMEAQKVMERLLNGTYDNVKALLERNLEALDTIIERLCTSAEPFPGEEPYSGNSLTGLEVNEIVTAYADKSDLARRDTEKAVFM